ncbi:MAG: hypothetical protein Q7V63_06430 [Gammaproteobacteria bacterium]|nr:hypothetical protein [Gammaproteobacteria bacterium]
MNKLKIIVLASLSLMAAQSVHAVVMGPLTDLAANCDSSSTNAVIDDKAQMQGQLCALQNVAKMQQLAVQNQIQNLGNTQAQIQALQQKIALASSTNNHSDFKWVPGVAHVIPANAVIAGQNAGKNITICQAQYSGNPPGYAQTNLYPGQLDPEGCVITYAGQTFVIDPYNILTSTKPGYWGTSKEAGDEPVRNAPVFMNGYNNPVSQSIVNFQQKPATAVQAQAQPVIGGYEYDHYLYVCRIKLNNTYQVGKVVSGNCNVAVGNKEGSWPDYQVLMTAQPTTESVTSS